MVHSTLDELWVRQKREPKKKKKEIVVGFDRFNDIAMVSFRDAIIAIGRLRFFFLEKLLAQVFVFVFFGIRSDRKGAHKKTVEIFC